MRNDLIGRYIFAVISNLPEKARTEVRKDLEGSISEMLDARCADGEPTEADVRAVLTELGAPDRLAAKYNGDEGRSLIGGYYLFAYKRVLKIVLPIVAIVGVFLGALTVLTEGMYALEAAEGVGNAIGNAVDGAIQAFAVITIVFAILQWKGVQLNSGDFFSKLPKISNDKLRIKPYEPVLDLCWWIAVAVLLLGFPKAVSYYSAGTGWTPILNLGYVRAHAVWVVLWTLFLGLREGFKLVEGYYTRRLAVANGLCNLLAGVSLAVFLANDAILSPAAAQMGAIKINGEVAGTYLYSNRILLAVFLGLLALDAILMFHKARKYGK